MLNMTTCPAPRAAGGLGGDGPPRGRGIGGRPGLAKDRFRVIDSAPLLCVELSIAYS